MRRMRMNLHKASLVAVARHATIVFVTVAIAACSQNSSVSAPESESESTPVPVSDATPKVQQGSKIPYSIGDITYGFYSTLSLNRRDLSENIAYEEEVMLNFDSRVTLAKARVFQPYPEQIWMHMRVGTVLMFPGDAVLVTARLIIDEKEVDTFEYVFGEAPPIQDMRSEKMDLRSYLEGTPESTLVRVELIATLFKHTEAASIDPKTVERPAKDTVTVYSNPMRVEFVR